LLASVLASFCASAIRFASSCGDGTAIFGVVRGDMGEMG